MSNSQKISLGNGNSPAHDSKRNGTNSKQGSKGKDVSIGINDSLIKHIQNTHINNSNYDSDNTRNIVPSSVQSSVTQIPLRPALLKQAQQICTRSDTINAYNPYTDNLAKDAKNQQKVESEQQCAQNHKQSAMINLDIKGQGYIPSDTHSMVNRNIFKLRNSCDQAKPNNSRNRCRESQNQLQDNLIINKQNNKLKCIQGHNNRKEKQKEHHRMINRFKKKKTQIAKLLKQQNVTRHKDSIIQQKIQECSKNMSMHALTHSHNRTPNLADIFGTTNAKQSHAEHLDNRSYRNIKKASWGNSNDRKQKLLKQLAQINLSSSLNSRQAEQVRKIEVGSPHQFQHQSKYRNFKAPDGINYGNMIKREVYLSNISNLEQLRYSLSHSRTKFHRRPIKMERQIGKLYTPFQDKPFTNYHGLKGIFI